jgi:diketogulonate reductase-like aldo/keto reductase
MRSVSLPSGETVPALGQGTWKMGDVKARAAERDALRLGLSLGMTLIDTAEMYGEGKAEELVAEAIAGHHNEVFLVSKVYPHNASRKGAIAACERSLKRLNVERLDLYLLHWRGEIALEETVAGFEALKEAGKIRHWGVSNFDTEDMEDLFAAGGRSCAINQILYNLQRRGSEWDLLSWMEARNIPVMAYSPLEQARLKAGAALSALAQEKNATPYQIALAWLLSRKNCMVIPKAATLQHVRENAQARDIVLDGRDFAALDAGFPPPTRKSALPTL